MSSLCVKKYCNFLKKQIQISNFKICMSDDIDHDQNITINIGHARNNPIYGI